MWACVIALVLTSEPGDGGAPWVPRTWTEDGAPRRAYLSPVLVAERGPTPELARAVHALDPSARVVFDGPAMRLWAVRDGAATLAALPALLPVLHDLPSTASRLRVPVGVVCGKATGDRPGFAALDWVASHSGCLPNFWYRPQAK